MARQEQVLAVPRHELLQAGLTAGLIGDRGMIGRIQQCVLDYGDFYPRDRVEKDVSLLQPVPCAIVHSGERILVLERSERSGKKKHPLHGKFVLWAGGHVRIEDALTGRFDVWLEALERELEEELDLPKVGTAEIQVVVWDGQTLHFGVVFDLPTLADNGRVVAANGEFRARSQGSSASVFMSLDEIAARFSRLDSWSRIIWTELFDRHMRMRGASAKPLQVPLALIIGDNLQN